MLALSVRQFTKSSCGPEYSRILDSLPRAKHAGHDSAGPMSEIRVWKVLVGKQFWKILMHVLSLEPNTSPIYWVNVLAGIGKSTIPRTLTKTYGRTKVAWCQLLFTWRRRAYQSLHDGGDPSGWNPSGDDGSGGPGGQLVSLILKRIRPTIHAL